MNIREYLKLARSFNAVLTGVSPVMGALAMGQYNVFILFLLFLVGFFGHTFGFVFNDIIDYTLDTQSQEISDRPLVSGTITKKNAYLFAFAAMFVAFLIASLIAYTTNQYFPLVILLLSAGCIALYDLISKKYPFTDIFVALGIFFLIIYGALTVTGKLTLLTPITWIVGILGAIQVLYMQIIAGGMKDIENDYKHGANTLAVKLGVRIYDNQLIISKNFKAIAYGLQLVDFIMVGIAFYILKESLQISFFQVAQWILLIFIALLMFFLSHKLLSMKRFDRMKARKYIGSHYMINFALVPIMLMTQNLWIGLLAFFPALGFILSNLILHGTLLQPKTM
ncbi:MAG: UbiA prenyltransferase family protein [Candidatus Thermoplasmatota archaeon]